MRHVESGKLSKEKIYKKVVKVTRRAPTIINFFIFYCSVNRSFLMFCYLFNKIGSFYIRQKCSIILFISLISFKRNQKKISRMNAKSSQKHFPFLQVIFIWFLRSKSEKCLQSYMLEFVQTRENVHILISRQLNQILSEFILRESISIISLWNNVEVSQNASRMMAENR